MHAKLEDTPVVFTPCFYRSLILHGSIMGLIIIVQVFFFLKGKWSTPVLDETKITVMENVVRVDVVAMPKFTLKELKAMEQDALEEKSKIEEEEKEVKKVADDSQAPIFEKEGKSFQEMMEEMKKKKIESVKDKEADKKALESEKKKQEELKKLLYAGNKLETGTSLEGKSGAELNKLLSTYNKQLIELVRTHWTLPPYLKNQDLNCRVRIYLRENGELLKLSLQQSSGNKDYDERALTATKAASPFPQVPTGLRQRFLDGSIVLGFPL